MENLIDELRRYLIKHPNAGDNRDGIVQFWLDGIENDGGDIAIDSALNKLIEDGWLAVQRTPGGGTIYMATARVKRLASESSKGSKT